MTVHKTGPLTVTDTDCRYTHRGVEIAVKVIDWGHGTPFVAIVERVAGEWTTATVLVEFDDILTPEKAIATAGGPVAYVRSVLVPKINAWLSERFKPIAGPTPPPAPDGLSQIDGALLSLRWVPATDGTLRVQA